MFKHSHEGTESVILRLRTVIGKFGGSCCEQQQHVPYLQGQALNPCWRESLDLNLDVCQTVSLRRSCGVHAVLARASSSATVCLRVLLSQLGLYTAVHPGLHDSCNMKVCRFIEHCWPAAIEWLDDGALLAVQNCCAHVESTFYVAWHTTNSVELTGLGEAVRELCFSLHSFRFHASVQRKMRVMFAPRCLSPAWLLTSVVLCQFRRKGLRLTRLTVGRYSAMPRLLVLCDQTRIEVQGTAVIIFGHVSMAHQGRHAVAITSCTAIMQHLLQVRSHAHHYVIAECAVL